MSCIAAEERISIESNTFNSNFHGSFLAHQNTQHAPLARSRSRASPSAGRPSAPTTDRT